MGVHSNKTVSFRLPEARQRYRERLERLRARQAGYSSDLVAYDPPTGHLRLACTLEPEFLCGYGDTIEHHAGGLADGARRYVPRVVRYTVSYALAVRPRGRSVAFDRLMAADLDVDRLDAELDHIAFLYGTPLEDDEVFLADVSGEATGPDHTEYEIHADFDSVSDSLVRWIRRVAVLPEQLHALHEVGLYGLIFQSPSDLN